MNGYYSAGNNAQLLCKYFSGKHYVQWLKYKNLTSILLFSVKRYF